MDHLLASHRLIGRSFSYQFRRIYTISLPNKIDNLNAISLGLYFFIPSHIFFLGLAITHAHTHIYIYIIYTYIYIYTHIYIYIYKQKYWQPPTPPQKNAIVSCRCFCDRQGYWSLAYPGYAYAMPACTGGIAGTGSSVEHGGDVADHGKMLGTHGNMLGKCVFKPMTVGNLPENSEMDMCVS